MKHEQNYNGFVIYSRHYQWQGKKYLVFKSGTLHACQYSIEECKEIIDNKDNWYNK